MAMEFLLQKTNPHNNTDSMETIKGLWSCKPKDTFHKHIAYLRGNIFMQWADSILS